MTIDTIQDTSLMRNRSSLRLLVPAVAIALLLTGCQSATVNSHNQLNAERGARGLAGLTRHPALDAKAQAWADAIAARGRLAHSNLSEGTGGGWRALGENVAMAGSVEEATRLFLNSPSHRATMLSSTYTHVGIGVSLADGRVWIVHVFAA